MTSKTVRKRDGTIQKWNNEKIKKAIQKAFSDTEYEVPELETIVAKIQNLLKDDLVNVESVQDTIEMILMEVNPQVARMYIRYRTERSKLRNVRKDPDPNALANYIHASKYASDKGREIFEDTVDRYIHMHIQYFKTQIQQHPELKKHLLETGELIKKKKLLGSMRALQFGGKAMLKSHARGYNCASTHVNRIRVFSEIFYLLLNGCGVGYSIQFHHVEQLPEVKEINESKVRHFIVPDTIEGWADSVMQLMLSYFVHGEYVEFSFHKIRDESEPLSTGGVAPGHIPLKRCLHRVRKILNSAIGRRMRPIEIHDIICHIADAVLAGGIRRSALIALFSPEDSEMTYCKAHGNFVPASANYEGKNSHRQLANNSAVFLRSEVKKESFDRLMKVCREWGEPGFYFTDDLNITTNPCGEISKYPILGNYSSIKNRKTTEDETIGFEYEQYLKEENTDEWTNTQAIKYYGSDTGFQMCNLTEINVATCELPEDLIELAERAAFLGTLQAAYNSFPYLGPVTEKITRKEALLGVSLTGVMDNPDIGLNPTILKQAAKAAIKENEKWAKVLGINPAARVTCIKPSGTASLVLGGVGSGIHYHHARRYFRRVTANVNEPIAKYFIKHNPHMVENKPNGDVALVFPTKAPDGAKTVKEEPALEFLNHILNVYQNWVVTGSATKRNKIPVTHNVSCTISVREEEWTEVLETIWNNKDNITAMSFVPVLNDKKYPFAPREEVTTEADEAKWNYLIDNYVPVDYSQTEDVVARNVGLEIACGGGACEI